MMPTHSALGSQYSSTESFCIGFCTSMSTTLIYNATVWRWNEVSSDFSVTTEGSLGRAEQNCFVTTRNGFIVEVSEPDQSLPPIEAFDTVIGAKGHLLIPGLIGQLSFSHAFFAPILWRAYHFHCYTQTRTYMFQFSAKANTSLTWRIATLWPV